jgi:hypothetical protein
MHACISIHIQKGMYTLKYLRKCLTGYIVIPMQVMADRGFESKQKS